jgi:DNA-binding XRE family transcriptional regulator
MRPLGGAELALRLWEGGRSLAEIAVGLRVSLRRAKGLLREAGVGSLAAVRCGACGREITHRRLDQGRGAALCLGCVAFHPEADFARRLRAYRLAAALTQGELAGRAGLSTTTVWQYEQGETVPRAPSLARLAAVLGGGLAGQARAAGGVAGSRGAG